MLGLLRHRNFTFHLYVDLPPHGEISTPISVIQGWFGWKPGKSTPLLKLNHVDAEWAPVQRTDVKRAMPTRHSQGFRIVLDLTQVDAAKLRTSPTERFDLELVSDGIAVAKRTLRLTPEALRQSQLAPEHRRLKQEWLKDHMACPLCSPGEGQLDFLEGKIQCRRCGETFPHAGCGLDFLPPTLRHQFRIEDAPDISAHYYDDVAKNIIEDVRRKGGRVLDCGSGLRPTIDDTVICLDVEHFPSVDVLAVNQRLPFRSAVFDAVLSLNVLEHVTDPFACAAELVRVLKPGGTLYCCIPFLQPEHGYPHHYFNATRSGLRELFPKDLEVLQHVVPRSGEPVWTLEWFLSVYAAQLPSREKKRFLNLRMKDIAGNGMGIRVTGRRKAFIDRSNI